MKFIKSSAMAEKLLLALAALGAVRGETYPPPFSLACAGVTVVASAVSIKTTAWKMSDYTGAAKRPKCAGTLAQGAQRRVWKSPGYSSNLDPGIGAQGPRLVTVYFPSILAKDGTEAVCTSDAIYTDDGGDTVHHC